MPESFSCCVARAVQRRRLRSRYMLRNASSAQAKACVCVCGYIFLRALARECVHYYTQCQSVSPLGRQAVGWLSPYSQAGRERSELLVGRHTHQGPRLCRFHPGRRSGRVSERAIKQHIAAFASLANHTGTDAAVAAAGRKSQKSLLRPRRRLLFMVAAFAAKSRPLQRFAAAPNAPAVNKWNAQNPRRLKLAVKICAE